MPAATVRIDEPTHETLRELSAQYGEKMSSLLSQAVKDLRRKKFMEAVNADFAALRSSAKAWDAEIKDRAAWDATLADGLRK